LLTLSRSRLHSPAFGNLSYPPSFSYPLLFSVPARPHSSAVSPFNLLCNSSLQIFSGSSLPLVQPPNSWCFSLRSFSVCPLSQVSSLSFPRLWSIVQTVGWGTLRPDRFIGSIRHTFPDRRLVCGFFFGRLFLRLSPFLCADLSVVFVLGGSPPFLQVFPLQPYLLPPFLVSRTCPLPHFPRRVLSPLFLSVSFVVSPRLAPIYGDGLSFVVFSIWYALLW